MREVQQIKFKGAKMKSNLDSHNRLTVKQLGIVDQVKQSMKPNNRIALVCGGILGGFVPIATYVLAHCEVDPTAPLYQQYTTLLVLGGLIYSAMTVFSWAKVAFKHPIKAIGFVCLLEGTMTFSHSGILDIPLLSLAALTLLVAINAVAAGTLLVLDQKSSRK